VPQQPSVLHPAVRLLASVLLFVPIWYGFAYANDLMLALSMAWIPMATLALRDMWFEVDHRDAMTAAVEPDRFNASRR
jgi:hypothetical protein